MFSSRWRNFCFTDAIVRNSIRCEKSNSITSNLERLVIYQRFLSYQPIDTVQHSSLLFFWPLLLFLLLKSTGLHHSNDNIRRRKKLNKYDLSIFPFVIYTLGMSWSMQISWIFAVVPSFPYMFFILIRFTWKMLTMTCLNIDLHTNEMLLVDEQSEKKNLIRKHKTLNRNEWHFIVWFFLCVPWIIPANNTCA